MTKSTIYYPERNLDIVYQLPAEDRISVMDIEIVAIRRHSVDVEDLAVHIEDDIKNFIYEQTQG